VVAKQSDCHAFNSQFNMPITNGTTEYEKAVFAADSCRWSATRQPWELTSLTPFVMSPSPFVVSLSNHEQPFDMLRANGIDSIFVAITDWLLPNNPLLPLLP